jgi:hypothetical protein
VAHFFLLGGPGETSGTLDETLNSLEQLKKSALFFFCGMRIYPNTKLFDIAVEEGQIPADANVIEPVFYRSPLIEADEILGRVRDKRAERFNWIIGSGGAGMAKVIRKLHERGRTGPLWEYLVG